MDGQLDGNKQERAPCVSYFSSGVHLPTKELREVMRKKTNNARERMRVKSMNIEYKLLEKLTRRFVPMEKQPTRLQILKSTIESIFTLERKLQAILRETRERECEEREAIANSCTSSRAQKIRKQSTSSSVPSVISYGTSPEDINATSYYNL
ncbi:unnamed protein product [Oikopleura dioica]|uniref:BHLH domain-containing protein n=1 Tax=Oikopleura dioica TaxID=34765 RepID=E4XBY7_OIKDI|nr:unnamed protein product [Oikopleura dioica]